MTIERELISRRKTFSLFPKADMCSANTDFR